MYIAPLDAETRRYIEAFAAVAIVVINGRAVMVRNPDMLPSSAQAVFWTKAEDAERVIAAGDDVEAAARYGDGKASEAGLIEQVIGVTALSNRSESR